MISLIAGLVFLRQGFDPDGIENINGALFFCVVIISWNTVMSYVFVSMFPSPFLKCKVALEAHLKWSVIWLKILLLILHFYIYCEVFFCCYVLFDICSC